MVNIVDITGSLRTSSFLYDKEKKVFLVTYRIFGFGSDFPKFIELISTRSGKRKLFEHHYSYTYNDMVNSIDYFDTDSEAKYNYYTISILGPGSSMYNTLTKKGF